MKNEIWKPIKGQEGKYEISNQGQLYSYPRKGTKGGYSFGNLTSGYPHIVINQIGYYIHNLVYETFIGDIPEGYEVHHKNHIKTDNRVENLELLTKEEHNEKHKLDRANACTILNSKSVAQYNLNGKFIAEYPSIKEAAKQTGLYKQNICGCCKNKIKSTGGFVFQYVA